MTLDEMINRLANGENAVFESLYRRTEKTVYYIALSILRERPLAEDAMQSAYLKIIAGAASYRKGTNAIAWVARIARNEAINLYNKRKREISVDERESPESFGTTEIDDYGLLVDTARKILPQDEFAVLMLVTAEGYKRREIAKMLDMPVPTVSWKYSRAIAKMQKALKEEGK